jgi:hypothetical protein
MPGCVDADHYFAVASAEEKTTQMLFWIHIGVSVPNLPLSVHISFKIPVNQDIYLPIIKKCLLTK